MNNKNNRLIIAAMLLTLGLILAYYTSPIFAVAPLFAGTFIGVKTLAGKK